MQEKKPSKRKTPAYEAEKAVFATKLRECMKSRGENQTTLAEKIGVQRQTISLYMNGQSSPNTEILTNIASALNVSADYLLGLSDVPQVSADLQVACKYTGLTPTALESIRSLSSVNSSIGNTRLNLCETLSLVCESTRFSLILDEIAKSFYYSNPPAFTGADFANLLRARLGEEKAAMLTGFSVNDVINLVYPINEIVGSVALSFSEAANHHSVIARDYLQQIIDDIAQQQKREAEDE